METASFRRPVPKPLSRPQPLAAAGAAAPTQIVSAQRTPLVVSALFLIFLFFTLARPHEFLLHIPKLMMVLGCLSFLAAVVSMGVSRVLSSRLGILLLVFTLFMALSAPFGYWKAGSLRIILAWLPSVLLFVVGGLAITSHRLLRSAMYVMALASAFLILMSSVYSATVFGRLTLGLEGATLGNANDLATVMLFCFPCWLLAWNVFTRNPGVRLIVAAGMILSLVVVARTGSRSAMVSLMVMALVIFWHLSVGRKVLFAVTTIALALMMSLVIPKSVKARLMATEATPEDREYAQEESAAIGSAQQRKQLLLESLKVTALHPILGVGPGQFSTASAMDTDPGKRQVWLVSHNAYTQVSSELGIPGFVLYLAILITCLRITGRILKRAKQDPRYKELAVTALSLRLCVICYCVSSFFASIAYMFYVPTLAALCLGLYTVADQFIPMEKPVQAPLLPLPVRRSRGIVSETAVPGARPA